MIPGLHLIPAHPRTVAFISEVDGVFVVEPMHFLTLTEARNQARAVARTRKPRRAA
jgi:hypothetical protein